jgi:hypothetical protein
MVTLPPFGVNFTALKTKLLIRLLNIWASADTLKSSGIS